MKRRVYRGWTAFIRAISRTGVPQLLPQTWRAKVKSLIIPPIKRLSRVNPNEPHRILGHVMFLHPTSSSLARMAHETYEMDTVKVVERLLSPGMSFLDIGAHVGYYTLLGARLVGPNGTVYAFEPQPDVYRLLVKNIHMNGYSGIVVPIQKAVTEKGGSVLLYDSEKDSCSASIFSGSSVSTVTVECESVSLDEFFGAQGWPAVDLIKMDIEGAEPLALGGMLEVSRRNEYLKLVVEYNSYHQSKAGVAPEQFFAVLEELGFSRFYAIRLGKLLPIRIPVDIPRLLRMAYTVTNSVNLLAEK